MYDTYVHIQTLNWEIFATNTIHDFRKLTPLANSFVVNIPVHIPRYRLGNLYGETQDIFSLKFFCLPDLVPIHKIYCLRIFPDLAY